MKQFKIVILGHGDVGKSSITMQFVSNRFLDYYNPTIEDLYQKDFECCQIPVRLEILDTAGFDQFTSMRDLYIKNGDGFIIVYNILNDKSFNNLKSLKQHILNIKGTKFVPLVLVGNKLDLACYRRVVDKNEGQALAVAWGCSFFEISAQSSDDVNMVFNNLTKQLLSKEKKDQANCCVL